MRQFIILMVTALMLASCNSVKRANESLLTGNYDDAINRALEKLRKSPSEKKASSYILLLEEGFNKAVARDNERLAFLKAEANENSLGEIYELYTQLDMRQQKIKPLLPLRLPTEGRDADIPLTNYTNDLVSAKANYRDFLYTTAITDLSAATDKQSYRNIYENLETLNKLAPNYKDVRSLMNEAHTKGTDFIKVELYNDSNIIIPGPLQEELLDFTTYDINEFWKTYHSTDQNGISYDYVMDVSLQQINISPERINEKTLIKEKNIKDGTEFLRDEDGQFVLDEDGKKIEVDKFIDVRSTYNEVLQSKAVNIVGEVRYTHKASGQLVERFPLASEFIFEHYYATYKGDKRALDDIHLQYIRNRAVPFPTNEQMVFDVGEDLKLQLKNIIKRSRL